MKLKPKVVLNADLKPRYDNRVLKNLFLIKAKMPLTPTTFTFEGISQPPSKSSNMDKKKNNGSKKTGRN